jgi:hypothetical protein
MLYMIALALAPRDVLAKSQFLRPMTNGLLASRSYRIKEIKADMA